MSWYVFYRLTTGRMVSEGSEVPPTLDTNEYGVLPLADRPPDSQMWDETTRTFVARPVKVPVDRVQDFIAQPGVLTVWNSLTAARKTTLQNALIALLGNQRFRSPSEPVRIGEP